jgi:DNA-binding CsgD family transcriptional regulator
MKPELTAEEHLQRARVAFGRGEARACRRHLDAGLHLVGRSGSPVEAALLLLSAQVIAWTYDPDASLEAAEAALVTARRAGVGVAESCLVLAQALSLAGSPECLERFAEAATAAGTEGDVEVELEALSATAAMLQAFGRASEAIDVAADVERVALREARTLWVHRARWTRARIAWLSTGQAAPWLPLLRELARRRTLGLHRPQLLADIALMLADIGETDAARAAIRSAVQEADTRWTAGVAGFYRAEIAWASGDLRRTVAAAEDALAADVPAPTASVVRATRLWALFEAEAATDDPALRESAPVPMLAGVTPENEAFGLIADGDLAAAEAAFRTAASRWRGNVARHELRALWGCAELAMRRGEKPRARALLLEVDDRAQQIGCVPISSRARASLRRLERQRAGRPAPGHLTRRERETLQLVAAGLPSREIALRLDVSARTVDAHIAAAMAKLGATTRAQAASTAAGGSTAAVRPGLDAAHDERRLLSLLASGKSVSAAASELGISRRTASRKLRRVRQRNGLRGNAPAVAAAALGEAPDCLLAGDGG